MAGVGDAFNATRPPFDKSLFLHICRYTVCFSLIESEVRSDSQNDNACCRREVLQGNIWPDEAQRWEDAPTGDVIGNVADRFIFGNITGGQDSWDEADTELRKPEHSVAEFFVHGTSYFAPTFAVNTIQQARNTCLL